MEATLVGIRKALELGMDNVVAVAVSVFTRLVLPTVVSPGRCALPSATKTVPETTGRIFRVQLLIHLVESLQVAQKLMEAAQVEQAVTVFQRATLIENGSVAEAMGVHETDTCSIYYGAIADF